MATHTACYIGPTDRETFKVCRQVKGTPHRVCHEYEEPKAIMLLSGTMLLCQVASCMENRSEEMVKALYNMTKVRGRMMCV